MGCLTAIQSPLSLLLFLSFKVNAMSEHIFVWKGMHHMECYTFEPDSKLFFHMQVRALDRQCYDAECLPSLRRCQCNDAFTLLVVPTAVYGIRYMAYGTWPLASGGQWWLVVPSGGQRWPVVYGIVLASAGQRYMAHGIRHMVHGIWYMVHGQCWPVLASY
jgi:hypothetical protein